MDLLGIALILLVAWIAIIVVAVALARAAGQADARADAEMRRLAARPDTMREPSDERTPLDALADEVMRTNTRAGGPERADERPAADQPRPAPKRFKRRSRFTARRDRIKNLPD
jgi:biopolymer transport protein ExbB/TolQ